MMAGRSTLMPNSPAKRPIDVRIFPAFRSPVKAAWAKRVLAAALEAGDPGGAAGASVVVADDDTLLESFGRHETRVQQDAPAMLYPNVLRQTMRAIGAEFGHDAWTDEAEALGASVKDWLAFPDSVEALAYLKNHFKLVVLSNVDNESFVHSNQRLSVEFDAVITAQDVGSYKPNPDNFTALSGERNTTNNGTTTILFS